MPKFYASNSTHQEFNRKKFYLIRRQFLGVTLLTILGGAPLLTTKAQAAPDPNPRASQNNDRRNRDNRDGERNDNRNDEIVGTLTDVRSCNSFDLRASGRTYNVQSAA